VDRGVDGGEFLQGLDVPEFRHCPFGEVLSFYLTL